MAETLIQASEVYKKFCRKLKPSLWYGVVDVAQELCLSSKQDRDLRPHEFWSLAKMSLELKRGEVLGLIGSNGAGKTTALRLFNGLIKPDRGSVCVRGKVGALISLGTGFNPILTGRENIYITGALYGLTRKQIQNRFSSLLEFSELEHSIDAPVQTYSTGMLARLGFSLAIHLEPDIFLIDEVLSVGDISFNQKSMRKSLEIAQTGKSGILLVSHHQWILQQICDRVIWLDKGKVRMQGRPEEVLLHYQNHKVSERTFDSQSSVYDRYRHLGRHIYFKGIPGISFSTVELLNTLGVSQSVFDSQEGLEMRFNLSSLSFIEEPVLWVKVLRVDGTVIWEVPFTLGKLSRKEIFEVRLKLQKIQLVGGKYIVSVRVREKERDLACSVPVEFAVQGNPNLFYPNLSQFEPDIRVTDVFRPPSVPTLSA